MYVTETIALVSFWICQIVSFFVINASAQLTMAKNAPKTWWEFPLDTRMTRSKLS